MVGRRGGGGGRRRGPTGDWSLDTAAQRGGEGEGGTLDGLAAQARALPGGTPTTAIVVVSTSQIEPHASGLSCTRLRGVERMALEQRCADTIDDVAVRVIDPRAAHTRARERSSSG